MSINTEPTTIEDLSAAIDEFSYNYDTYGYKDACDDREAALAELTASIHSGKVDHLEDWLLEIVKEKDSNSLIARKLFDCLRIQKQQGLLQQFLNNPVDAFAIFQLKDDAELRDTNFERISRAQMEGQSANRENYLLVYTDQLKASGNTLEKLDLLYYQFNVDHPRDFKGHSLSVRDIVALKQNGAVSCYYVASIGFEELPNFLLTQDKDKSRELSIPDSESTGHESTAHFKTPKRQKDAPEKDR